MSLTCPHCSGGITHRPELVGQLVRCQHAHCRKVFTMPQLVPSAPAAVATSGFAGGFLGAMVAIGVVFGSMILLCGGCFFLAANGLSKSVLEDAKRAAEQRANDPNAITMAKFNRVEVGMDADAAIAILGKQYEVVSDSKIGGERIVMLSWDTQLGESCTIMLQGGRVMSKTQIGLK